MRTKSYKRGIEERNAYCEDCDWSDHSMTANTKARYHVLSTGHKVDVYTETRTIITLLPTPTSKEK